MRSVFLAALVLLSASGKWVSAHEGTRLLIVVSVDQLSQEYLTRFADNFSDDGVFRRIAREGASYTQCHHRHAFTVTAPGHAVQLSGAYPNTHGIVGNNWFDRVTGRDVYCVEDEQTEVIGAPTGQGMSPRTLLVETVGDVLKMSTRNQSRVYGVAIKDRAAILMTGHKPDGAFWLQDNLWVTSSYYGQELPGYLRVLNESQAIRRFHGRKWELTHPRERYHNTGPDRNDWENPPKGMTCDFPHQLAQADEVDADVFGDQVLFSPYGNELTLEAARELITYAQLGRDEFPDLLCVNFSSNDYVGHAFGPHSLEVEDMTYQTDRQLGEFMDFLDERVGRGQWTLAITADHGVAPIVEYAVQAGLPARRSPLGKLSEVQAKLEAHLRQQLAIAKEHPPVIQKVEDTAVYIVHQHPALPGEKFRAAQSIVRDWLLAQPNIVIALTRDELVYNNDGPLSAALHRAWHPRRSGDVLFVYAPYCVPGSKGTTHGSPWHYDTHVPMLLYGAGVQPGKFHRPVSPACLASTAAELLGVDYPSANVEQPLREALSVSQP